MATERARTKRVNVRVSDDIMARLNVLAEDMGLAATTLASYAISDFVTSREAQKRNQQMAVMAGAKQAASVLEKLVQDPEKAQMIFGSIKVDEDQLDLPDLGEKA